MAQFQKKDNEGFTLVETAVVMAVISIATGVSFPVYRNVQTRAVKESAQLAVVSMKSQCETSYTLGFVEEVPKVNIRNYRIQSTSNTCEQIQAIPNDPERWPTYSYDMHAGTLTCDFAGAETSPFPECKKINSKESIKQEAEKESRRLAQERAALVAQIQAEEEAASKETEIALVNKRETQWPESPIIDLLLEKARQECRNGLSYSALMAGKGEVPADFNQLEKNMANNPSRTTSRSLRIDIDYCFSAKRDLLREAKKKFIWENPLSAMALAHKEEQEQAIAKGDFCSKSLYFNCNSYGETDPVSAFSRYKRLFIAQGIDLRQVDSMARQAADQENKIYFKAYIKAMDYAKALGATEAAAMKYSHYVARHIDLEKWQRERKLEELELAGDIQEINQFKEIMKRSEESSEKQRGQQLMELNGDIYRYKLFADNKLNREKKKAVDIFLDQEEAKLIFKDKEEEEMADKELTDFYCKNSFYGCAGYKNSMDNDLYRIREKNQNSIKSLEKDLEKLQAGRCKEGYRKSNVFTQRDFHLSDYCPETKEYYSSYNSKTVKLLQDIYDTKAQGRKEALAYVQKQKDALTYASTYGSSYAKFKINQLEPKIAKLQSEYNAKVKASEEARKARCSPPPKNLSSARQSLWAKRTGTSCLRIDIIPKSHEFIKLEQELRQAKKDHLEYALRLFEKAQKESK